MKKPYLAPKIRFVSTQLSSIVCVSFGEDTTPTMYSKEQNLDIINEEWNETDEIFNKTHKY